MTNTSLSQVIVALDFPSEKEALHFLDKVEGKLTYVKVGMQLYYSQGPELIEKIKAKDLKIFLDLKLHDIPATVAKASQVLAKLKIDMVNVHAAGGFEMMKKANQAYKEIHPEGKMIAVTQLTSTSQEVLNQEIGISGKLSDNVLHYAKMAKEAGLDGVVCSAWEAEFIKEKMGETFLCVTPGIRLNLENAHDQKRVKTPAQAIKAGADFLVMGREITKASNPKEIVNSIEKDLI
ncbi:MAG: orotidine-5'-phosphate decarboxylase [Halobacteriovoraceae bacterium]|nr:orotidine-5'-phosphate decarboxylase [Halobacteriovoraceae bacterium]|tara:strand:+ start:10344 stop:11048 length:705 start_codon:yes stop_codon:yes gene_type:complete